MAFGECFPLDTHSHFAQALSLVFCFFRLLSGGFAFRLGPAAPFFPSAFPLEVAEVEFSNHESELLC